MSDRGLPDRSVETAKRRCPECLGPVTGPRRKLFCCDHHKQAFQNRMTVRGKQLTPLSMAARLTRGGSRRNKEAGKHARHWAERLQDNWNIEDREAGRMPMDEYIDLRRRLGYEVKLR